jgi:hypothetical protein
LSDPEYTLTEASNLGKARTQLDYRDAGGAGAADRNRHETAISLHEHTKHVERPRSDHNRHEAAAFILLREAPPIETKALEQKRLAGGSTRLYTCASP